MKILLERARDRGYLPDCTKSLFIPNLPDQEAAASQEFEVEGLELKFVLVSSYLGDSMGSRKDLE